MAMSPTRIRSSIRPRSILVPLTIIGVVLVAPIAALIFFSFTKDSSGPTFEQFQLMFERLDFFRYARNSLALGFVYTVPVVCSSFCAGYAFARLKTRGSNVLFGIVVATMLVPVFVYLIPLFVVYSRLHLTNTVIPWLLWGIAGNSFYIFLFRQFFDGFPSELEEAAMLDGLNRWSILTRIVLPNSYTAVATVAILAFTNVWGEALVQSVLLYNDSAETLSVRLAQGVIDPQGISILIPPTLAAVVIYVLPPVIVFIAFQRFILRGVATSGLK